MENKHLLIFSKMF